MTPGFIPTDEQLVRFLHDECDAPEAAAIQAWLAQDASHGRRLEGLRRVMRAHERRDWNVDGIVAGVLATATKADPRPSSRPIPSARSPWWRSVLRHRAAAALLVASVGGASAWIAVSRGDDASAPLVYETARGQSTTVHLSDGSRVRLAPESRLTVGVGFASGERELTFVGEGEFDVRHDAAHPFRVRTATSLVEDVGTRFAVRAYSDEPQLQVAVAEGAVALAPSGTMPTRNRAVVLRAGEIGVLDGAGVVAVSRGAAAERALAWTKGRLVFDRQPLRVVLATLGRWYDLDIRAAGPGLAEQVVTAGFSAESVAEMLEALAAATGARVDRSARAVVLRRAP